MISASLILRVRDLDGLERFNRDVQDPTRGGYHRFLKAFSMRMVDYRRDGHTWHRPDRPARAPSALLSEATGSHVGFWNPMLYRFAAQYGYREGAPLRDVTAGDNWFYRCVAGYEPAAGLGVPDVANLLAALRREIDAAHRDATP